MCLCVWVIEWVLLLCTFSLPLTIIISVSSSCYCWFDRYNFRSEPINFMHAKSASSLKCVTGLHLSRSHSPFRRQSFFLYVCVVSAVVYHPFTIVWIEWRHLHFDNSYHLVHACFSCRCMWRVCMRVCVCWCACTTLQIFVSSIFCWCMNEKKKWKKISSIETSAKYDHAKSALIFVFAPNIIMVSWFSLVWTCCRIYFCFLPPPPILHSRSFFFARLHWKRTCFRPSSIAFFT